MDYKHEEEEVKEVLKYLAEIRKEKGITQQMVSDRSGLIQQSISAMENGNRMPLLDTFLKYLHSIGISMKFVDRDGVVCCSEEE